MNSQETQEHIKELESKREELKAKRKEIWDKQEAELKVIRDKYEEELNSFNEEISEYDKSIKESFSAKQQLVIDENWQEALDRGVINEFYLKSMLEKAGVKSYFLEDMVQKKTTKNGIETWMIFDDGTTPWKLYLAFYKGALVGISHRQKAAHAGDHTEPFSFIGQFDEPLMTRKERTTEWNKGEEYFVKSTYTEWAKELKSLDLEEANLIPMNDETLEEIRKGIESYWYEWGWRDRAKDKEKQNISQ